MDADNIMNYSDDGGFSNASQGNETETFDYDDDAQQIISWIVPILFGITVVVGLFGNLLVFLVVMCNQQMRNTTNLLIINLSLADLLFIIFCVPFTAVNYALELWPFGDVWCKIVQYMLNVCAYASVYTLVLMSLDRFLAVVHPIPSMSIRTERNTMVAIVVLWIIILISCLPVLMSHGLHQYIHDGIPHSACYFLIDEFDITAYQVSFFCTSYLIPLTLICGLYLFMLKRLWYGVGPGGHISAESLRGKKRVTLMVVVVVFTFAACWFPVQVILLLKSLDLYELTTVNVIIQIFSQVLAYMNSCINPILYAFLSENFRKAFRKIVTCFPPGRPSHGRGNGCKSDMRGLMSHATRRTSIGNGNDFKNDLN